MLTQFAPIRLAVVAIGLVLIPGLDFATEPIQGQDKQTDTTQADNELAAYFAAETGRLAERSLADIQSADDWNRKKNQLREQLFEMLGLSPRPEKTDLQVTFTGTTEHEEFVVRKLHFQSRPGLYVTGNLYLPRKIEGRLPAVLYVCGHGRVARNGVSYGNKVHYHHHGSWFARNGYVCLTIDTLQLGEIEGIHHGTYREKMWWWLNRGYTPAGVEAWNCIRALDLLQSLPEVDGSRLGVTGRSGGGAYSWWIAALDERIQCAVPVAGITDLENHVVDGCVEGHCDCMFMVNTFRWDYPQVAALVAPRPLLISNTDNDGIFPLDGVYRTYRQTRRIYELLGAGEKVGLHITNGPHQDTQELRIHAFRWFNHHLKNDDSLIHDPAEKFFEPEQLKVFAELPADQQNTEIHETFVPAAAFRIPESAAQWNETGAELVRAIRSRCFAGFPEKASELLVKRSETQTFNQAKGKPLRATEFRFESQPHVPLVMWLFHRVDLDAVRELDLVIAAEEDGEKYFPLKSGSLKELAIQLASDGDRAVALLFPRGIGPGQWNPDEKFQTQTQRRFYLLGQTVDGMRVLDILRATEAVRGFICKDVQSITYRSRGKMAINAVYASCLDGNISRLDLVEPTASHRQGPYYLNVSRFLDVPQALALAARKSAISIRTDRADDFEFAARVSQIRDAGIPIQFHPQ